MHDSASQLGERVRLALNDKLVTEKRMFGGLAFLLNGNMLCCVSSKGLMVRIGATAETSALQRPHVARCTGAGRPMAGFLIVNWPGFGNDADLQFWLGAALAYVAELPPKPRKNRERALCSSLVKKGDAADGVV